AWTTGRTIWPCSATWRSTSWAGRKVRHPYAPTRKIQKSRMAVLQRRQPLLMSYRQQNRPKVRSLRLAVDFLETALGSLPKTFGLTVLGPPLCRHDHMAPAPIFIALFKGNQS